MMAMKPRRYFSLKAYRIGLMQLFALPNHWAIGVKMFKNSSVLESRLPPKQEINGQQFVFENVNHILRYRLDPYRTSLWQKQHREEATRAQTESPQVQAGRDSNFHFNYISNAVIAHHFHNFNFRLLLDAILLSVFGFARNIAVRNLIEVNE